MKWLGSLISNLQNSCLLTPPFHLRHWRWVRLGILVVIDVALVTACYWGAFFLRLDSVDLDGFTDSFIKTLPVVIGLHLVSFYANGMYRQVWRHANLNSAVMVARSIAIATLLSVATNFLFAIHRAPPRSVPIIYWLLATLTIAATRFSWRMWSSIKFNNLLDLPKERCFIYGAGSAGALMAQHAIANTNFPYQIVAFVDDDRNKSRRLLHGLKIFFCRDLGKLSTEHDVTAIIVAMPSASGGVVRDIFSRCTAAGLKPLIMPDMANSLGSDVFQPRAIDVKDLLRRAPRSIDLPLVSRFFHGAEVLVTGAGGSIGAEICRQLIALRPRTIILFDTSEFNLFRIENELREMGVDGIDLKAVMGSTIDRGTVDRVFREYRPTCVIHAAAYKHVDLVERNPAVGVINNVLGTKNLIEASVTSGVRHFLLISTDKAVRPTSVMGSSKRCCELLVQAAHQVDGNDCTFASVRFGNVLGSSGSVIPRFIEQIQAGGPVTVTHPDVTRFFMLIPEAVALCLQAISMASGGEIYLLNMGESVKIREMAEHLIRLAGKEPGNDIEIIYTGLKPGEKLYEELILEGHEEKTSHDDLFKAIPQNIDTMTTLQVINDMLDAAINGDVSTCLSILRSLVQIPPASRDRPTLVPENTRLPVH